MHISQSKFSLQGMINMRYRNGIRLILSSAYDLMSNFEFYEMVFIIMFAWVNYDVVLLLKVDWILATSPCVLAWVYTSDSLLIKDVKRLWPIHTVQISNMQYAFGVPVYGEVLYLEFYSVFSEQFINDEILLCNSCENGILHTIKE